MLACPVLPKYHSKRLWRQGSKLELSHLWHIIKGWWYYHYYTGVIWHGRVMPWCGRWRRKPELLGLSVYYRVEEESSVTCIPGSALSLALLFFWSLILQPVPAQLSKERHIIVCLGTPVEECTIQFYLEKGKKEKSVSFFMVTLG